MATCRILISALSLSLSSNLWVSTCYTALRSMSRRYPPSSGQACAVQADVLDKRMQYGLFLLSDGAAFLYSATISMDGGFSAFSDV